MTPDLRPPQLAYPRKAQKRLGIRRNLHLRPKTPVTPPNGADSYNALAFKGLNPSNDIGKTMGVTYYGYRYFDPTTGRWPSRDPGEENWLTGEYNPFAFIKNDPVASFDVLGLHRFDNWFGFDDPIFQAWYHIHYKPDAMAGDVTSREQMREAFEQWESEGRPNAEGTRTQGKGWVKERRRQRPGKGAIIGPRAGVERALEEIAEEAENDLTELQKQVDKSNMLLKELEEKSNKKCSQGVSNPHHRNLGRRFRCVWRCERISQERDFCTYGKCVLIKGPSSACDTLKKSTRRLHVPDDCPQFFDFVGDGTR